MTKPWDATSEHLLRELAPQVLGAITRRFRDFASAEDAVQEAMIAAFRQWPQTGIPDNPRGWLIQARWPVARGKQQWPGRLRAWRLCSISTLIWIPMTH